MKYKYDKVYDFSVHNGLIDWDKLKAAGVDFVMLRAGYGKNNIDERFYENATACIRLGIPFGIYWFSYAYTVEMAEKEAGYAIEAVRKYKLRCPVAYDLEYDTVRYAGTKGVSIGKELATGMAEAFCSMVNRAGYMAVNYANKDYLQNMFDSSILNYPLWFARYHTEAGREDMILWQHSSTGRIVGVSGNVDMNYMYQELDSINSSEPENDCVELLLKGETELSLARDGNKYITLNGVRTNFKVREFRCKDGTDLIRMERRLIEILHNIRTYFNKPVVINSAYRTVAYNEKVKGADKSYHLSGSAADIKIEGITPLMIAAYAEGCGVKGIGMYNNFTHVDTREKKYFWVNKSVNSVATFGGSPESGKRPENETILKLGSCGKEVEWLQRRLNKKGADLQVDGIYGENTRRAVADYQSTVCIKADGIAGDITIGYLAA